MTKIVMNNKAFSGHIHRVETSYGPIWIVSIKADGKFDCSIENVQKFTSLNGAEGWLSHRLLALQVLQGSL